jgi:GT2 family glycosyltransferase
VCTHGRPEALAGCLRSVLALRAGDADRFELLVIDNAPPDARTRQLVAGLPEVRYAVEPRPGLDFARNRALAEAGGEWVAFLDDDVEADDGWLAGLEEALAENPDAGALTGLVLPAELESEAQIVFERRGGFRRGFAKLRYEGSEAPGNPLYPVGAGIFGAGCNMALRRDAVLAMGGFDEALDTGPPLPGGGDLDIFYRVVRAGLPLVYEPSMLVRHGHRRDLAGLRRQYRTWGDGLMAFLAKTHASDPPQRAKVRAMVGWWAGYELGELARGVGGRGWGSPDLPAAELAGGLAGLLTNSYGRSARRVRAIRERHA